MKKALYFLAYMFSLIFTLSPLFISSPLFAEQRQEEEDLGDEMGLPKNESFYMDKVYSVVKNKSGDLKIAVNNFLISVQEKNLAASALKPQLSFDAKIGVDIGRGDYHSERKYSSAGFSLFQPILSFGRYYDWKMSKLNIASKKQLQELREQQYLVQYAEALIRISERKTQYYFAQERLNFLENYRKKVLEDLEAKVKKENERRALAGMDAEVFDPEAYIGSAGIDTEIEDQKILIAERKTAAQIEINDFRINFLRVKQYPFEKMDNMSDQSPVISPKEIDLSHYDPSILDKVPLPKYLLVNPFKSRKNLYPDSFESVTKIFAANPNFIIARQAILEAGLEVKKQKSGWWPEIGAFGEVGGNWSTRDSLDAAPGSSYSREFTRSDEFSGGLMFSWKFGDGGARRARTEIAKLRELNAKEELANLQADTTNKAAALHRQIKTSVEVIAAKIELYKKSKLRVAKFLEQNIDPAATVLERRLLVDDHYKIAQSLALEQHEYLARTLRLLSLRNELRPEQFKKLEEDYFIDCSNYDAFVKISKVKIH